MFFLSLISLFVSLGGLIFGISSSLTGWSFAPIWYVRLWLPILSLCGIFLILSAYRAYHLSLIFFSSLFIIAGVLQVMALGIYPRHRFTYTIAPAFILFFSIFLLIIREYVARGWNTKSLEILYRRENWLLAFGLLTGMGYLVSHRLHQIEEKKAFDSWKAADVERENTLHGLERAAWMLEKVFSLEGFSSPEFINQKKWQGRFGEFYWDEAKKRVIIVQSVFSDSFIKEKLLSKADQVMQHPLLTLGKRPDLGDGTLSCKGVLDCSVTWEVDVEVLKNDNDLPKNFVHSIAIQLLVSTSVLIKS